MSRDGGWGEAVTNAAIAEKAGEILVRVLAPASISVQEGE